MVTVEVGEEEEEKTEAERSDLQLRPSVFSKWPTGKASHSLKRSHQFSSQPGRQAGRAADGQIKAGGTEVDFKGCDFIQKRPKTVSLSTSTTSSPSKINSMALFIYFFTVLPVVTDSFFERPCVFSVKGSIGMKWHGNLICMYERPEWPFPQLKLLTGEKR